MGSTYSEVLHRHNNRVKREEDRKAAISKIYEDFSNGKIHREGALSDLYANGISRDEAVEKLDEIQKAIDSMK